MITTSNEIAALATALADAQAEIENAAKDGANPHFRSKYASMEAVVYACKATLPKQGLSYVQFPGMAGEYVTVTTRLMHKSGEWIEGPLPMPVGKRVAHGVGSAISYARRYSLMAVVGIAAEDDDGHAAAQGGEVKSAPPASKRDLSPHPAEEDRLDWGDILEAASEGVEARSASQSKADWLALRDAIRQCQGPAELARFVREAKDTIWSLHSSARHHLREIYDTALENLMTKG